MNFKALTLLVGPEHREHSGAVKVMCHEAGKIGAKSCRILLAFLP